VSTTRRTGLPMHLKAMLLAITTAAALSASTDSGAAVAPLTFAESGLGGGGFQNVIAIDPADSGLVLAGGDTSGIYRSLDWRHVARRVRCLLPLDRRIRNRRGRRAGRAGLRVDLRRRRAGRASLTSGW